MKQVLFVSGSIGLGHVGRDLEIAGALRKLVPEVEISWMAEHPAVDVLNDAGEKVLPEADLLCSANAELEGLAQGYQTNLIRWALNMRKGWSRNAELYVELFEKHCFDLVIGDESYDIIIAMLHNPKMKKSPFAVIYDFLGLDATTGNPVDHFAAYMTNRLWSKFIAHEPPLADVSIFIGEPEDVQDKKFGFMLPNRRRLAEKLINFVGYVLPEDIEEYRNKAEARRLLGYNGRPMILCSIGGTSAGKQLLGLCTEAFPIIKAKIPNLQMTLVCGPRVPADSVQAPEGAKVEGYVPKLYRHMAAADLCIVTGGGTITLELTALQRPFIYFPLEQHFEQEVEVATRCQRHNAGIRMTCSKTTPDMLADLVLANIGKDAQFKPIPIKGAQEAAKIIQVIL
jgi:UDP:flavonoid glycosyltransferase YjiC (YdhE family)